MNENANDHHNRSHVTPNFIGNWPPTKGKKAVSTSPFDEIAQQQKRNRQIVSELKSKFRTDKFASFSQAQIAEALDAIISQWGQVKIPLRECATLCNLLDDVRAVGYFGRRVPVFIGRKLESRFFQYMKNSDDTKKKQ